MSDSTEAGFMGPTGDPVPYDDDLVDLLQPVLADMLGFEDRSLVRPSWQPDNVPNQPDQSVDWASLAVPRGRHDTFAAVLQDGEEASVGRSEELEVRVTCYGPKAAGRIERMRACLSLSQNRAPLKALGFGLVAVSDPVTVPALLAGRWMRRVDATVTLRRYASWAFPVRSVAEVPPVLLSAPGAGIDNEHYVTPVGVDQP